MSSCVHGFAMSSHICNLAWLVVLCWRPCLIAPSHPSSNLCLVLLANAQDTNTGAYVLTRRGHSYHTLKMRKSEEELSSTAVCCVSCETSRQALGRT